jgi:hypothetical protein
MDYTAEVTIKSAAALTEDDLFAVAEIGGVAVGNVGDQLLETTLTVSAKCIHDAGQKALELVQKAVSGTAVAVKVMTTDEADRRNQRMRLGGVTEVAALLGVSKQRVSVLCRRQDFPAPVEELSAGPIWRMGDLTTFAAGWQRRPGRPRKALAN